MENINLEEMCKYLAVMLDEEEIEVKGLAPYLPVRTVVEEGAAKGKPSIAFLDCDRYRCRKKGQKDVWKPKWVWDRWRKPGKTVVKMMMAIVMREQVRVIVSNHLYTFSGRLYKQLTGGPIGLKLTTIRARIVLMKFDERFKVALSKLSLDPVLLQRYVDDVNAGVQAVPKGMVLQKSSTGELELVLDIQKARSREERDRARDERTAHLYGQVANTVMPKSIVMEVDYPSAHSSKRIPILDMEVWMSDDQVITFNHYSKPMASTDVIMARSTFTTREKKNILLEEASRRLRNCSPHCTWEEKCVHITTLNLQMLWCGH